MIHGEADTGIIPIRGDKTMSLYDDPKLVAKATRLQQRGLTRKAIADKMGLGLKTVRKIFDPVFAEAERLRLREVDAARAPRWSRDQTYRDYQELYGKSAAHLTRVRNYMRARRAEL